MIKVVNPIKNNDCSSNIKDFEVPKFSKAAGAEKIYERDGYITLESALKMDILIFKVLRWQRQ